MNNLIESIALKKAKVLCIMLGLTSMGFQCGKEPMPEPEITHQWLANLNVSPQKATYKIGDTIQVWLSAPNHLLLDQKSKLMLPFDSHQVQTQMLLHRIKPLDNKEFFYAEVIPEYASNISWLTLYTWYNQLTFNSLCQTDSIYYRVSFVLKTIGIFTLEPSAFTSPCAFNQADSKQMTFQYRFNISQPNTEVWNKIPENQRSAIEQRRLNEKEIYLFEVE